MPTSTRRLAGPVFLFCAFAVAGCGGERIKLVPVEGVVKINGKPAANLSLQFMPDTLKGGKGPTSFGTSDESGKFTLKTNDGRDGAAVGPHRVVLADLTEERPPQGREAKNPPRLNASFTLPSSGLQVEVKEGGPALVLEATGPR